MSRAARQIRLAGVFAAIPTPRREDTLEADFSAALDLLDFVANAGVAGVCALGSTGEFVDFNFTDRQRLVYLSVKRSRVPLIAGVSHSSLAGALQLAAEAISSGADALIVMPPYFFRYEQPEVEAFLSEFGQEMAGAVPLLLYNIPQFTSPIAIETVARLAGSGLFAGIKDSSGDWDYFERLLALRRNGEFAILAGNDRIAARALRSGADGVVSGCAAAIPEIVVGLARAVSTGDERRASELDSRLQQFMEWIDRFPTPAAIRRAVELRGNKCGRPLVPLSPARAREMEEFAAWFKTWLPAAKKGTANA